jgi:hypothetical protein
VIVARCEHGGSRGDNVGVDLGHGDLGGGALCVSMKPRISPSHPHLPTLAKCDMALSPMLPMAGVNLGSRVDAMCLHYFIMNKVIESGLVFPQTS